MKTKNRKKKKPSRVAIISEQRHRVYMEDAHSITTRYCHEGGLVFGGVYDGHGSSEPAIIARDRMPWVFEKFHWHHDPLRAFVCAYGRISSSMKNYVESGTCAANFYICNGIIYHANVGDTEIYVCGKGEVPKELSIKHRVSTQSEYSRLCALGNKEKIRGNYIHYGALGLMPTRTLGDQIMKKVGVTHRPSVGECEIQKDDRFLVVATDGLFDCVTPKDLQTLSRKCLTANGLAKKLALRVEEKHGEDNLTIIVLRL